ncbi:MAG: alpha-amylase family glycosyl hydrolase [Candidatus Spechtbacterales bacterium]|nr:alpha-amylase family glycosyl hydrolase [Candidatus Spechtbacterales bacterium]
MNVMSDSYKTWPWNTAGYQIYPRSFKDTTGNGIGDLQGIIEKLDYIEGLGVGAVWLSPFFPSPMADFGYDVADYKGVDPIFGTLEDFDELLKEVHKREMRLLIDFVPNHTSSRHPWFIESRSSKNNPKRNWYVWKDPAPGGGPPNNWLSVFGGSAWEYDKKTEQYYLHSFLKEQPDLNWDNPNVREAMKENLRFWLDMGVDGVRLDAVHYLSKDKEFRSDLPKKDYKEDSEIYDALIHKYSKDGPNLFNYLNELVGVLKEHKEQKFMITETARTLSVEEHKLFYEKLDSSYTSPFNFCLINIEWRPSAIKDYIDQFHAQLKPQDLPVYALENHDNPRICTQIGSAQARVAAMLLLTLPGMTFIYQGQELAMTDTDISEDKLKDPASKRGKEYSRDYVRTPMQWSGDKYGGFSDTEPWLPVNKNYKRINVEVEKDDARSMLHLYKKLIALKSNKEELKYGKYDPIYTSNKDIFAFQRSLDGKELLILLNFTDKKQKLSLNNKKTPLKPGHVRVMLDTGLKKEKEGLNLSNLILEANEGMILEYLG